MIKEKFLISLYIFILIFFLNSLHIFISGLYHNWDTITFVPGDWQSHWATIFDTCLDRFGKTDNIYKCAEGFDNRIISPYPFGYILLYVQENYGLGFFVATVTFSILHFIIYQFISNLFSNFTNNVKFTSILIIYLYILFSPSAIISMHTFYKDIWLFSGMSLSLYCFSLFKKKKIIVYDYFIIPVLFLISLVILLLGRNNHIYFIYLGFIIFFIYIIINYKINFYKNIIFFSVFLIILFAVKSFFPTTFFFKSLIFDPLYVQSFKDSVIKSPETNIVVGSLTDKNIENKTQNETKKLKNNNKSSKIISKENNNIIIDDNVNQNNNNNNNIITNFNKNLDLNVVNDKINVLINDRILNPQIYFKFTGDSFLNYDHTHYLKNKEYFKYIFSHSLNSFFGPKYDYYTKSNFSFFKLAIIFENIFFLFGMIFFIIFFKNIKDKQYHIFIFLFFSLSVFAIEFNNYNFGTFIRHRYFFWKMLSCFGLLLVISNFLNNKFYRK